MFFPLDCPFDPQIRGEILGPETEGDIALAGRGDLVGVEHAPGGLDQGHEKKGMGQPRLCLQRRDQLLHRQNIRRALALGNEQGVRRRADDLLEILDAVRGRKRVDAHNALTAAEFQGAEGMFDEDARRIFFRGRH